MKRIISSLIIISVICGAFFFIQEQEGTNNVYYTKITNNGKKRVEKIASGESITNFQYNLRAVTAQGKLKNISFTAPNHNKPLKRDAYLKLSYSNKKGIISWEEIQKKDVPAKALTELDKTA